MMAILAILATFKIHMRRLRQLIIFLLIALSTAACARPVPPSSTPPAPQPTTTMAPNTATAQPPSATTTDPIASVTTSAVTLTFPTETPPLAAATATSSLATLTPFPGLTPTSAALNPAVPPAGTGDYECGDYPCFDDAEAWEARINVPPGFEARYLAQVEPHPTSFTFGPDGLLYVARQEGEILTVDAGGRVAPYLDGFYHLVSIAFQPGTDRLFAASRGEGDDEAIIWVIENGETNGASTARKLYDGLPCCYGGWHQANGIAFGPDGYGYVPLGALSDHGERAPLHPLEATILRFHPDGGSIEPYARGLRNTFDITWDSAGRLFGADNMPDHGPPEEFNEILPGAEHGFPYYDCQTCTPTPPDLEIVPPLHDLLAHSAPTGITTYLSEAGDTGDTFPGYYDNIFLTLWSSVPGAQKVIRFSPGGETMTDFATGFAAPVDVTVGATGSLYVVDWATGIVFEIRYVG